MYLHPKNLAAYAHYARQLARQRRRRRILVNVFRWSLVIGGVTLIVLVW